MAVKDNNIETNPTLLGSGTNPVRVIAHLKATRGLQGALSGNTSTDLETLISEALGTAVVAVAITNGAIVDVRIQFDGSDADDNSALIPSGATLAVYGVKTVLDDVRLHATGGSLDVVVIQYVNL